MMRGFSRLAFAAGAALALNELGPWLAWRLPSKITPEAPEPRPWISYAGIFELPGADVVWRRTFCPMGIHLFDEWHSFGPSLIGPELIAAAERETGMYAQAATTGDPEVDEHDERGVTCSACGLSVPIADDGGAY
jgi:hypothetical protein